MSATQSFTRQIAAGSRANCFRSVGPVVFSTAQLAADGKFGVKGALLRNGSWMDFDQRWATLNAEEVVKFIEMGTKDASIQTIRVVSLVAGGTWGAGTEEALLVSLTESEAAIKLAEEYGLIYEIASEVGQGETAVEVVTQNAIAITVQAAMKALGLLQFPGIEKAPIRSRADAQNPSFQACLSQFDVDGTMPQRVTSRTARIDEAFSQNFNVNRNNTGRTYGSQNGGNSLG